MNKKAQSLCSDCFPYNEKKPKKCSFTFPYIPLNQIHVF